MAMHFQTVAIIHNMSLTWPPTVEAAFTPFELLGGNLDWLQPECVCTSRQRLLWSGRPRKAGALAASRQRLALYTPDKPRSCLVAFQ